MHGLWVGLHPPPIQTKFANFVLSEGVSHELWGGHGQTHACTAAGGRWHSTAQNIRSLNWIGVAAEKHFVRRGKDGNQCDDRAKASEYFMSNDVVLIADDKFPTRRYTEIKRHWLPDEWRHLWLVLQHNIGAWTVMCESCNFTNAYANWGRQSNMHYAQKYHTAVRREPCT